MGVAEDNDVDAACDRIDPHGLEIVTTKIDRPTSQMSSVSGYSRAQTPVSTFPLMVVTGAISLIPMGCR
jgi:hypothetical protein